MIRLSEQEISSIKQVFKQYFLPDDKLWLFGSRVKEEARGGDIDLYIETSYKNADEVVDARLNFITELQFHIGEQKIDVVTKYNDYELPIYKVAQQNGVRLI